MAREARYRRNRAKTEAAMARPLEGMGSSEARGRAASGWGGLWTARGSGGLLIATGRSREGGEEVAHGMRRVRALAKCTRGQRSRGAAARRRGGRGQEPGGHGIERS